MKKQPIHGTNCEVIILLKADDVYGILNKKIQSGGGTSGSSGDMLKSVYDTTGKGTDIFSYTDTKIETLNNTVNEQINNINESIQNKADISNVLTKDNTTEYTPTNDYNPATKKYIDDIVGPINTTLDEINGEVV